MSPAKRSSGPRQGRAPARPGGREPGGGKATDARRAASKARKAAKAAGKPLPPKVGGRAGAKATAGRGGVKKASARRSGPPAGRGSPLGAGSRPGRGRAGSPAADNRPRRTDRGLGGEQIEGRQAVRELLLAGRRKVYEIWIGRDQDEAEVLDDIAELALSIGVPVRDVSRAKLAAEARTESPQGVLAKARPLPETDFDELLTSRKGQPAPFLLALDGVTDPGNLGALLRSAECAGVTGIVLPRHRAVHVTPTVTKAAAGAVEYLPMTVVGGLPTALAHARKAGVWVIGLDSGGSETIFDLAIADEPVLLVLGAEGAGLSRLVRERCDTVAAIPLTGNLASLNVSVAGALACFEIVRRRHQSA